MPRSSRSTASARSSGRAAGFALGSAHGRRPSAPDLTRTEDLRDGVARQERKFEQIDGRLMIMAGGPRHRAAIAVNAATALSDRLRPPCRAHKADCLVAVAEKSHHYPDVTLACGQRRAFTDRWVLIAKVLAPATNPRT